MQKCWNYAQNIKLKDIYSQVQYMQIVQKVDFIDVVNYLQNNTLLNLEKLKKFLYNFEIWIFVWTNQDLTIEWKIIYHAKK